MTIEDESSELRKRLKSALEQPWQNPPCWCPDLALAVDCPKHAREEARKAVESAHAMEQQLEAMRRVLEHVRQTVHQAHHPGGIEPKDCRVATCRAIAEALK